MSEGARPPSAPRADSVMPAASTHHTAALLHDETVEGRTIADKQWEIATRRLAQQDLMIRSMIKIFSWLNGAVVAMVMVFWVGDFWRHDPIVTEKTVISIVGATIIQAGLAFMSITKFLFPSDPAVKDGTDAPVE